jgi:anti-anti-sigma factor
MEPSMSLPTPFDVTVHPDRATVRVVPSGELDAASRSVLAAHLDDLWKAGWADIVVDLRELTFMDSSGVHLLLQHHLRASETGARFGIIDGRPPVARTLQLCGVHEILTQVHPADQASRRNGQTTTSWPAA